MKKNFAFSLLLTVGLLLSACGGAPAPTAPSPSAAAPSASAPAAELGGLLSSTYAQLMRSGRYLMHYRGAVTAEGVTMEMECTLAVDGDTISNTMTTEGMTARTLYLEDTVYSIDDASKTYRKLDIPRDDFDSSFDAELEYVGKGSATVNGREMDYEEYRIEDGTLRFYFDGKTLYAIVTQTEDGEAIMEILELSDQVPDDMLTLPVGYTEGMGAPQVGQQLSPENQAAMDELMQDLIDAGYMDENGTPLVPEGMELPDGSEMTGELGG